MITVHSASRGISDSFYSSLNKLFVLGVSKNIWKLLTTSCYLHASYHLHVKHISVTLVHTASNENMWYDKIKTSCIHVMPCF